jgi:hypothetical protein
MKVSIKSKETVIEVKKDQIVEVLETADGIAFNLRNNLALIYTNNFLPLTSKQLIKGTIDTCNAENGTIVVDLDDPQRPASIMIDTVAPPSKS